MNMNLIQKMTEHRIEALLDIGANVGQYATMIKSIFPNVFVLSIEPNRACESFLEKIGVRYIICCPSDRKSIKKFYRMKSDALSTGCSLYRENTHHFSEDNLDVSEVETDTLDSILEANNMSGVKFDMMKLDTQGSELDILRGSRKTLESVKLVVAETDVGNYNIGCPTQGEIVDFMEQNGFVNLGSVEDHYALGKMVQQDLLFEKTSLS